MERLILRGPASSDLVELREGCIRIGRGPNNDVRVLDPSVSSVHCELVVASLAAPTIHVRDLNSTNGTYVDGERIQDSLLQPGQLLCLGTAELRLVSGDVPVVRIPKPEPLPAPFDTHLLDGQLACQNHPGTAAAVRCTHCERVFCLDCVHSLGLEGRQRRLFCPCCSHPCEMLAAKPPRRKGSIFARLTQTVRIWLNRVNRRAVRPGRRRTTPTTRPGRAA